MEECRLARTKSPDDALVLGECAFALLCNGQWEEALAWLERARTIDPRAPISARRLTYTLLWLRRYPEALGAADRALALAPRSLQNIEQKAMVQLARGDMPAARAVLRAAEGDVDPRDLAAFVASTFDLFWALDDEQQQGLLRTTPVAFDGDRLAWGLALAQTAELRGDLARSRELAEQARRAARAQLADAPGDAQRQVLLALALALLGRHGEAVREGERAVALRPLSRDAYIGAYLQLQMARIYRRAGKPDEAIALLEQLLVVPCYLSPAWLRIDPEWKSLRDHPRFKKLASTS